MFQAELYENIDPEAARAIISVTRCLNRAMHEFRKSANILLTHISISNYIDKDIMTFEDT